MTRKEQKEARKWQIIRATLDLFVERGYYGTKTSQISKRADISEGLLFHYFPTKEILLEELINIGLEGMRMPMQIRGGEWSGLFPPIYQNAVWTDEEQSIYSENVCVYGACGAG